MQCYQKSALLFLVLCCMQKPLKKSWVNKYTLFHMTFSWMSSKVYCLSSLTQYLSAFIYSLKEKPSSNCHQKCPSIGMLSGERFFSRSVTLGSNTFYCNKGRSGSSNDCILNQLDTYHSGLRTIFNLYYVKVRVKYNREPNSNDLLSCTLSFFIYFIK